MYRINNLVFNYLPSFSSLLVDSVAVFLNRPIPVEVLDPILVIVSL